MPILVPILLFGWLAVTVAFFAVLPHHRAAMYSFMYSFLFLPMTAYQISGFPIYSKVSAASFGCLLGIVLFDSARLLRFRPSIVDLPIIAFCLLPIPSYLNNQTGWGLVSAGDLVLGWGVPYFIGRLYFTDTKLLEEFALCLFWGGLLYSPLCILEMRISPQLHRIVYGSFYGQFAQVVRYDGYRPQVFMQHGLMLGMWMCSTSMIGFWLWYKRCVTAMFTIPMSYLVIFMFVVSIACKSTGAIILLLIGVPCLLLSNSIRVRYPLAILAAIPPLYLSLRFFGIWSGRELIDLTKSWVGSERAQSMEVRLMQENVEISVIAQKPYLGWSIIPIGNDQLWLILMRSYGVPAGVLVTMITLMPLFLILRGWTIRDILSPKMASALVLTVLSGLVMIDNLSNAMVNPMFTMAIGATVTVLLHPPIRASRSQPMSFDNRARVSQLGRIA